MTANPSPRPRVAVVTAEGARDLDARTIATLPDSFTLMHRAASAAADWLHQREERTAAVYVGPGNNGGDGWLIAALLRARGWTITLHAAADPRTADAQRAKVVAEQGGDFASPTGSELLIIDALLGTGASGTPRGEVAASLDLIRSARASATQPVLIAIDLPSALDATTGGDGGAVAADLTLTFGGVKRGQLLRRDLVGELQVLDIGLLDAPLTEPRIVDAHAVRQWIPALAADAWKGTRGRLAIIGGDAGMAGAVIIAARSAHASGAGMVRADVAAESALALQIAAPFATVRTWRASQPDAINTTWPHALVIGPGLDGTSAGLRASVLAVLHAFDGPVLLDAGALTAFRQRASRVANASGEIGESDVQDATDADPLDALRYALRGRSALLTPHIGEFNALFPPDDIPRDRFDAASILAQRLNATVLLKGVPTIIASPDGSRLVSAAGNQALAMGGTGDLLAGIAGALLAQGLAPLEAGAAAAWVHGTAAEQSSLHHGAWRGVTMELLVHEVSNVWPRLRAHTSSPPHTLLELPAVPAR